MSKRAKRNITNADCRKPVKARIKIYDADCSGLYVSLSPTAPPTFFLKYSGNGKRRACHRLGIYQAGGEGIEARDVAYCRVEGLKLRGRIGRGEDIAATTRQAQRQQAKQQLTVSQLIDLRTAWISEEVTVRRQTEQGTVIKKRPRYKDHENMASHLN